MSTVRPARLAVLLVIAFLAASCRFDGAYDLLERWT